MEKICESYRLEADSVVLRVYSFKTPERGEG